MRHALIAAALLAAPAAAMAEGIQYSYVDARYFSTDSDALNVNLQGADLAASYALSPMFFVAASGQYGRSEKVSAGTSSGSFDTLSGSLRVGAHHAITDTLDVVANGGVLYSEYNGKGAFNGTDDDGVGYVAEAGLRLALIPQVEVGAFYAYQDVLDESQSFFTAELQYHATSQFSVVGSASNAKNIDIYNIGVRYHF